MTQKLNHIDNASRHPVATKTSELMHESLRKAEEIRRGLEGRKHGDSTLLIAESLR
ncbi:MAG TPA: hypothetical protein VN643_08235 [Pyrinomonadaceae bacterium]|nr:hypothetical protein [Pyrinomonadaceae bacterium]